jgi:Domain of unknown function (DUF4383)
LLARLGDPRATRQRRRVLALGEQPLAAEEDSKAFVAQLEIREAVLDRTAGRGARGRCVPDRRDPWLYSRDHVNYGQLGFWENQSDSELFGLFQVSVLHNIVQLLFGVAGLAFARSWKGARTYLIGGGLIYLAFALYGALIDQNRDANFIPTNNADDYLHLVLGLGMVALAFLTSRHPAESDDRGRLQADHQTSAHRQAGRVGARVR